MAKSKYSSVKVGDLYNKMEVLSLYRNKDTGKTDALCRCSCGKEKAIRATLLTAGRVYSCGCSKAEGISRKTKKHGFTNNNLWPVYCSMLNRCNSPLDKNFDSYGGRGIVVCTRWIEPDGQGFLNFLEDMGKRPEGMTLDRIDVNGNYEPSNCRWADRTTQAFNIRKRKDNTSGYTGISLSECGEKYLDRISVNGKQINLETFLSLELAIDARRQAELKYYGELKPEAREES